MGNDVLYNLCYFAVVRLCLKAVRSIVAHDASFLIFWTHMVTKKHLSDPRVSLHSEQGQTFESNLIQELSKIAGVAKSRTTPYHAMGNGQVESFNQTLLQMLGTLEEYQKSDWKAHVPTLVHVYNATIHDSTGYSPYFLKFGRHPRLAIDAFLGLTPDTVSAN